MVTEVAQQYPQVALDHMYVDNAAGQGAKEDVTGNMFGDILDAVAMLTGSIGTLAIGQFERHNNQSVRAATAAARHCRQGCNRLPERGMLRFSFKPTRCCRQVHRTGRGCCRRKVCAPDIYMKVPRGTIEMAMQWW
jgi:hypothetical protein